jgi:hypothetical protein
MKLILLLVLLWAPFVHAQSESLSQYFDQVIESVAGSLSSEAAPAQSSVELSQINVGISASVGYGIPDVANISVSPSLSFTFAPVSSQ